MRRIKVAIDCDISPRLVPVLEGLYGHLGFKFIHVTSFAPPRTEDEHWAVIFKRRGGRITISADERIATTPHKALAFIDNGFISFFMGRPWHYLGGALSAAHIAHAWPLMATKFGEGQRGRCWRVPCSARKVDDRYVDLRLSPFEFEPLVIPYDVLENARRSAADRKIQAGHQAARGRREQGKVRREAAEDGRTSPSRRSAQTEMTFVIPPPGKGVR